jgi:hypothetical protein
MAGFQKIDMDDLDEITHSNTVNINTVPISFDWLEPHHGLCKRLMERRKINYE